MRCIDCGIGVLEFNEPFDNAPHGDSWYECVCGTRLKAATYDEITRLRAIVASKQAIEDRPLDDDLNVLWNRCESKEPLSIADQRELYAWKQENMATSLELAEKVERLETIVATLPKIGRLVGDKIVWDVAAMRFMRVYYVAVINDGAGGREYTVRSFRITGISFQSGGSHRLSMHGDPSHKADDCFNSRAAAEFAIKEARKS